jgi:hypothetical protein
MNIEQLSTMTDSELRVRANAHLEHLDSETESNMTKEHHVAQAQIYLTELDRREQAQERVKAARIAKRDFWLEIAVIVLIGAELVIAFMGYLGENKQMDVLDKLNKSGAATAATLTAVRQAQEASLETQKQTLDNIVAMNDTLRDEMDLNFTEALQYSGGMSGSGKERIDFSNDGRATLFFWGSKFDGQPPRMQQKATVLAPGSNKVSFDISDLIKQFAQTRKTSNVAVIPFELYFTRENGTKYVSKGNLQLNANNSVWIDRMTSTRKQW